MSRAETPAAPERFQPDPGNLGANGIFCRQCKHKSVYKPQTPSERLICRKFESEPSCSFARGIPEWCGLEARWFERSAFV